MFRLLIVFSTFVLLFSCSKQRDDDVQNKDPKFSFEFNGTKYNGPNIGGIIIYNGTMDGVFITREDLFGGTINFYRNSSMSNDCAYLTPTGQQFVLQQPGCILNNGNPIDSVLVFLYRSGSINYSTSNCTRKRVPDLVFGGYLEYDECDVTGTFSLTLGNKNNQTIVITNGSFTFYGVRL